MITRAKEKLIVVSSIPAENYLKYEEEITRI
jgi:hypothetical protein